MKKTLLGLGLLLAFMGSSQAEEYSALKVIAVHQIDDENKASFDFFTAELVHQCGGKVSNRFRSYSRNDVVADRKFQLVLKALENDFQLTTLSIGCEGNAMKVSRIGIRK